MSTLDPYIWWTGAIVLASGAALAAAAVVSGLSISAVWLAHYYIKRIMHMTYNMHVLSQWDRAGRPIWTHIEGRGYDMRPSRPVSVDDQDERLS